MARDTPEPCKFPSLDSCQRRFLWTHEEADLEPHLCMVMAFAEIKMTAVCTEYMHARLTGHETSNLSDLFSSLNCLADADSEDPDLSTANPPLPPPPIFYFLFGFG